MSDTLSLAQLQADYREKFDKAMDVARTKLKTELDLALLTFQSIAEVFVKKQYISDIWEHPSVAPVLKELGLRPVRKQSEPTSAKRGRKAAGNGRTAGTEIGNSKKAGFTKSEKKVLDFIAKGEKGTKEIAKHIGTANISPTLANLKNKKAIVARQEGLKKFWKRA